MSLDALNMVWKHSAHEDKELLAMLAIADNADDDGFAFPSYEHIAAKIRVSKRTAQRIVTKLLDSDELRLSRPGRWGDSNVYSIQFSALRDKPRHFGSGGQDVSTSQVVTQVDNPGGQQADHGTVSIEPSDTEPELPSAAGTLFDVPGEKAKPQKADDDEVIQEVWDAYVEVFGTDHLNIKSLTDARRKMIRAGLKASDGDAEVLKRAWRGLQEYRRHHPGSLSLDAVLKTRPGGSSLTEQLEFWSSQDSSSSSERHDIPSVLRDRVRRRRVQIVEALRTPHLSGAQERAEEARRWLREHAHEEPVIEGDKVIEWRRIP